MNIKFTFFFYFYFLGLFFNLISGHFHVLEFNGHKRALILGSIPVIAFFANIFWGRIADKYNIRKVLIRNFAWISAIGFLTVLIIDSFESYLFMSLIMGIMISPMVPLNDSLAINYCIKNKIHYGSLRQWGTISFIIANLSVMGITHFFQAFNFLDKYLLYLMPLSLFMIVFFVEDDPINGTISHKSDFYDLKNIFKQKQMTIFLAAVFMYNFAYVGNYSYFTPHLLILNTPKEIIALNWAIAPLGEIFIFRYSAFIVNYFSLLSLLRIGIIASCIRWAILTFSDNSLVITVSQLIHSVAFGTYYLAAIGLLSNVIPPNLRSTGQGIFGACISLATLFGNIALGTVYDKHGSVYVFMTSMFVSLLALILSLGIKKEFMDKNKIV